MLRSHGTGTARHARALGALPWLTVALASSALAQSASPSVRYREIASLGPPAGNGKVAETHLAVSDTHVLVVHAQAAASGRQGYAFRPKNSSQWTFGNIPQSNGIDPSVAYDAYSDRFVFVETGGRNARVIWWDPVSGFAPQAPAITAPFPIDKPWIVRGQNDATRQEFYVTATWKTGVGLSYSSRSVDGGASWTQTSLGVVSNFSVEPTVADTAAGTPLYVAWTSGGLDYLFLRGDDVGLGVQYSPLESAPGVPLTIPLNSWCGDCSASVPGPFPVKHSPHVAADPTDPNRIYFVYFDDTPTSPGDYDVFCATLVQAGGFWSLAGRPVRVNHDTNAPQDHFDQILPDLAVDDAGRVHVVFYDDRNYVQAESAQDAKFDVYYAFSVDGGRTFRNRKLRAKVDEPALDHALNIDDSVPLEYPGIATYENEVWVSFAGSFTGDTLTPDQSVIYVTRIQF